MFISEASQFKVNYRYYFNEDILMSESITTVKLEKSPTELYKILKFEGLASSGGEAKILIADGQVSVNNEIENRKRRKIVAGDIITFAEQTLNIIE